MNTTQGEIQEGKSPRTVFASVMVGTPTMTSATYLGYIIGSTKVNRTSPNAQ